MQTPTPASRPPLAPQQQRPSGLVPSSLNPASSLPSTPIARPAYQPTSYNRPAGPYTPTTAQGANSIAQAALLEESRRAMTRSREASKYDGQRVLYNPFDAQEKARAIIKDLHVSHVEPVAVTYAQKLSTELVLVRSKKAMRIRDHRVANSWGRDGPSWNSFNKVNSTNPPSSSTAVPATEDTTATSRTDDPMWHARVVGDQVDPYTQFLESNERARQEERAQRTARLSRLDKTNKSAYEVDGLGAQRNTPTPVVATYAHAGRAGSMDVDDPRDVKGLNDLTEGASSVDAGVQIGDRVIHGDRLGGGAGEGASGSDTPNKPTGPKVKRSRKEMKKLLAKPGKFLQQPEDPGRRIMIDAQATTEQVRAGTKMNSKVYGWLGTATQTGLVKLKKGGVKGERGPNGKRESGSPDPSGRGSPAPNTPRGVLTSSSLGKRSRTAGDDGSHPTFGNKRRRGEDPDADATDFSSHTRIDPSLFPNVDPELTFMDAKLALHREIARGGKDKRVFQIALEKLMLRMAVAATREKRPMDDDDRSLSGRAKVRGR